MMSIGYVIAKFYRDRCRGVDIFRCCLLNDSLADMFPGVLVRFELWWLEQHKIQFKLSIGRINVIGNQLVEPYGMAVGGQMYGDGSRI